MISRTKTSEIQNITDNFHPEYPVQRQLKFIIHRALRRGGGGMTLRRIVRVFLPEIVPCVDLERVPYRGEDYRGHRSYARKRRIRVKMHISFLRSGRSGTFPNEERKFMADTCSFNRDNAHSGEMPIETTATRARGTRRA